MSRSTGRKTLVAAIAPKLERVTAAGRPNLDRYARDPFAHCEDGHIVIPDLVTLQPVKFEPMQHQIDTARAWIDFDRLARTGELRWRNTHLEKSRQMGETWGVAVLIHWAMTHHSPMGFALSLNASEIDDGGAASTTDSLFGKIRYIASSDACPAALRQFPDGPLEFRGGNAPIIRHRYNPGAFVTGSGATPDPGRGGRFGFVFIDEAARLPFGEAAHKSIARACPSGRFYNSTPEGEDNLYARLRKDRPKGYAFLHHHWGQHPVYGEGKHVAAKSEIVEGQRHVVLPGDPDCQLCEGNRQGLRWVAEEPVAHRYGGKLTSPWYDNAIVELTDEQVASELDIDFTASLTSRVYPEFTEELHVAPVEIPLVESLRLELAWDYGFDTTSVVICQDAGIEYRVIGEVELHDTMVDHVADAVRDELRGLGLREMLLEPDWTIQMTCVGDPAGEQRSSLTGTSLVAEYRKLGFSISSQPQSINRTIVAVKRLLENRPKPLVVSPRCTKFINHVKHNRWPTDREGNRKPAPEPQNDRHNHMMRGFSYLVTWKFPPPDTTTSLRDATTTRGDGSGRLYEGISSDMSF